MTIGQARAAAARVLSPLGTGQLDADVLLKWILGVDQTHLLFHSDDHLSEQEEARLEDAVVQRLRGIEVCYITGHKEFYGLDFILSDAVMPPKSDTELLVDNTIAAVAERLADVNRGEQVTVCDMCCGSGCVGVALLRTIDERFTGDPHVSLVMADISDEILRIARGNAKRLLDSETFERVTFIQSDLFASFPPSMHFDVIAANPPYIPYDEAVFLLLDGRGEPMVALCGDEMQRGGVVRGDGLDVMRRLTRAACNHLKPGGALIVEVGDGQAMAVRQLLVEEGFAAVNITRDLADTPRNVSGRLC